MSKVNGKKKTTDNVNSANGNKNSKRYLIFSDAQLEFIEKHQRVLDVEFTEEEKKLSFI
jgi:hypothetical protein